MALCLQCAPHDANSCGHRWDSVVEQARGSEEGERGADGGVGLNIDALYAAHRGELVRFLQIHYGSGPPDPDDVVQQAFVNYAALGDPSSVRNPRAFLFRTVRNLTISVRRHLATTARYAADPTHEIIAAEGDEATPERVLLDNERQALLRDALLALPERRRKMFVLNQVHDMTQDEIAAQYGVSRSAVTKQLALALRDIEAHVVRALAEEASQ